MAKLAWPNQWVLLIGAFCSTLGAALQCLTSKCFTLYVVLICNSKFVTGCPQEHSIVLIPLSGAQHKSCDNFLQQMNFTLCLYSEQNHSIIAFGNCC